MHSWSLSQGDALLFGVMFTHTHTHTHTHKHTHTNNHIHTHTHTRVSKRLCDQTPKLLGAVYGRRSSTVSK